MNYSKLCKIIPMLDSPNDAEALSALRALSRALAPESFGDVARLIEANLAQEALPEPEAKPFTGFKTAARGSKPPKPPGDGWIWYETIYNWNHKPKPQVSRFETLKWVEPNWEITIDFPTVLDVALRAMALKLNKNDKVVTSHCAMMATEDKSIASYNLIRLEQIERLYLNV